MKIYHEIRNLHFRDEDMVVTIDGTEKRFAVRDVSPSLYKATEREKNTFDISPSGYGIHWPLIDEDISIDGLLGVIHSKEAKRVSVHGGKR